MLMKHGCKPSILTPNQNMCKIKVLFNQLDQTTGCDNLNKYSNRIPSMSTEHIKTLYLNNLNFNTISGTMSKYRTSFVCKKF